MALKYKFKTQSEIPTEHQSLYLERDGAWVLDADGVVEKAKLDEFRASNITLLKERDDLKQRFDGSLQTATEELQRLKAEKEANELKAQGHKPEEIEKIVEGRIKTLRGDLEKQVNGLTSERDALNSRLTAIQIDQGVLTAATKRGLRPTAIPDITSRARMIFKLVNGAPRAFEADGQTVRYGKDGVTPMTLEEWVDGQVSDAPHLFESNSGGGAASSAGTRPNGSSGKNPFRKETWNLTEQMKIQKTDPQLAVRLKATAH